MGGQVSADEFERILSRLKAERQALDADLKTLLQHMDLLPKASGPDLDRLQKEVREKLARLKQEGRKPAIRVPLPIPVLPEDKQPLTPSPPEKTKDDADKTKSSGKKVGVSQPELDMTEDVLHLAQTYFRAERYAEALEQFRKVDLKGKKPAERTPIVFMMARCLTNLGKSEEAANHFRDAANALGDEWVAGYAQWQLDLLRFNRSTRSTLDEYRQRRSAMEKGQ